MSFISKNILVQAYLKIKRGLPEYVFASVRILIPLQFLTSLLEIFGLVIIFPVINILLVPTSIEKNHILNKIFTSLNFTNSVSFALFLVGVITLFFILKNIIFYASARIQTRMAFQVAARLSYENYSYYLSESYEYFSDNNTALMLRNFSQIPFELLTFVVYPLSSIISELCILLILVVIMCFFDPILFGSILLFALPFVVIELL